MKKFITLSLLLSATFLMAQGDDDCTNAEQNIISVSCGHNVLYSAGMTSGPDAELTGACTSPDVFWFVFDFDADITGFTVNASADVVVFEGSDCASLGMEIDCGDMEEILITPGNFYFIGVEDGEDFTLDVPQAPSNEDCNSAEPLSENGTDSGNNVCASPPDGDCGGDHSVWWVVTVTSDASTLEIEITGGEISNPEVAIYDGCGGNRIDIMGNCDDMAMAECLVAGDYWVEVSSSTADAGTIDILATTTSSNITGDDCIDAIDLDIGQVTGILGCGDGGTESGDSAACPDGVAMDCMIGIPGIWYTFTTDPALATFDIAGDYELYFGSCSAPILLFDDCGANTVQADPNETYYVLVGPGGVDFSTPPAAPGPSCTDPVDGGSILNGTTCCNATGDVWIEIPVAGMPGGTSVDVTDVNGIGFDVEFYSGCPSSGGVLLDSCLLYTSPSPRDATLSRMPSSA